MGSKQRGIMNSVKLLEQALDDALSGIDAIPATELALVALRADVGEATPAELEDLAELEEEAEPREEAQPEEEPPCICPAELLARGGYRGGCQVHGLI
jgi:hypothetical protein